MLTLTDDVLRATVRADRLWAKLCSWLSSSTLAGLLAFTAFGWTWADAAAGLVFAGFADVEGEEAWEGELACDDDDRDHDDRDDDDDAAGASTGVAS